jgi:hypothetical protein
MMRLVVGYGIDVSVKNERRFWRCDVHVVTCTGNKPPAGTRLSHGIVENDHFANNKSRLPERLSGRKRLLKTKNILCVFGINQLV